MTAALTHEAARDLLYREALLIDTGRYAEWLALFTPDIEFWMPTWRDEGTLSTDPERELSLIYYRGRRNLEDRIMRLQSGLSVASTPPPRVVHMIANILVTDAASGAVSAAFTCHRFDVRMDRTDVFFGRYEYRLVPTEGGWAIASKKIILLNDTIPTVVDINAI
ncbi:MULTISPECIES: aromatic-ring-hydroxylating dioxygenase subunit beta [unclassified Sphingomonas]|uniref:aromatic-ring-hydroxylating dioxygenase subunit beta n=1 Tax=Novosphingobium rhizosphaerae TaxID=1551649 RepID=UPI0015CA0E00